ncbi:MAG: restriction endonuclease subunit S, partial [Pseudomonadaceae bacterium]|nr:restriction endonuclease subunit S [Pseudomonadaceae bacterium]
MSSEWTAARLQDLVSIKHGFAFKGEYFVDEVTPFQLTTPGNFAIGGGFQYGKGKYYSGPVPSDYVLHAGDLIVTMTDLSKAADTLGYAAIVPNSNGTTWLHNQRVGLVRLQEDTNVHMGFIHYLMRSPDYRHWVVSTATGSTVKHTSPGRILSYEFQLPSLVEQREIGDALAALDDRITLLRETNATLEAIAQALFKSWFVDFDPVHANAEGRARQDGERSGQPRMPQASDLPRPGAEAGAEAQGQPEGMDAPTAALFPDSFEESELGLVPKGWRVEWLSDVFDFKEGPGIRNWQYTNSDVGTRFINIRCIQDGDLSIETANRISDEEANGKYAHFHLKAWDVVVSTSGTLGRSAIVRDEHLPLMLNTSVIRFRPVEGKTSFSFVYEYLNAPEFLFKLESMASGSVQKNFGPMHLKQMKLVCPPSE